MERAHKKLEMANWSNIMHCTSFLDWYPIWPIGEHTSSEVDRIHRRICALDVHLDCDGGRYVFDVVSL